MLSAITFFSPDDNSKSNSSVADLLQVSAKLGTAYEAIWLVSALVGVQLLQSVILRGKNVQD